MYFASDNTAGVAPEILEAIGKANAGNALGYGNDEVDQAGRGALCDIFEREVAVFLVPTGTAANALALAHLSPPWGAVLCHAGSHIATDECGAPEFFGGGFKLVGLTGEGAKIAAATLAARLRAGQWGGPHHVSPACCRSRRRPNAARSIAPRDRGIADLAHEHGMAVHMDGARLGNALARMNVSPAEVTWKAGVDALSFGATKGGALGAEAVIFFDPERGAKMPSGASAAAHSPRSIVSSPRRWRPSSQGDLWMKLARRANAMADALAAGLGARLQAGVAGRGERDLRDHCRDGDKRLKAAGASYYPWSPQHLPEGRSRRDLALVRLVTSFVTSEAEVGRFCRTVAAR